MFAGGLIVRANKVLFVKFPNGFMFGCFPCDKFAVSCCVHADAEDNVIGILQLDRYFEKVTAHIQLLMLISINTQDTKTVLKQFQNKNKKKKNSTNLERQSIDFFNCKFVCN